MRPQILRSALALPFAAALCAQGFVFEPVPDLQRMPHLRPPQPVRATLLQVGAQITDGVATTELRQTFRNDGDAIAEATWLLPLPPGAVADKFTMTVGGKEMPAEVLDAQRARAIYEEIVRKQRDPGLLEYMGHGLLRARVFPIPARGEVIVHVRWQSVLPQSGGLHEWRLPLRAVGGTGFAAEKASIDVKIQSKSALKNVWTPFPGAEVLRKGDYEARVSLECKAGQIPEHDLSVFYGLNEQAFGIHLLTYRRQGQDGYYLMLLSPKQDWSDQPRVPRTITLVLDTSGSMQGQKIVQARDALRFFVRSLQPGDSFNVIPFSTEARPFFDGIRPADAEHVQKAMAEIDKIEARGGTNIEDALSSAFRTAPAAGTLPIVVFLTDGLPTVGTTDVDQLLALAAGKNEQKARVFVFGVGSDVNTRLLDTLAEKTRGERDYVRESENIEVKTGTLFEKLSHPVLTNVALKVDGIDVVDQMPKELPDLFRGGRVLAHGRYRGDGHRAIRLSGVVEGRTREYVFEQTFPAVATEHGFVATLWAQKKIAVLLDAIRLHGQQKELVDEVKRLGTEFGIVTPFTSHLIVEEGMRVAQALGHDLNLQHRFGGDDGDRGRVQRDLERAGVPAAPVATGPATGGALGDEAKKAKETLARLAEVQTGADAVEQSVMLGVALRGTPMAPTNQATALLARRVHDKTFYVSNGVWVDAAFTPALKDKLRQVEAYGDDYFALLREKPELARYLAFSSRLIVVLGDLVLEVR
jgi:Ca-activated chloride channel family protein